MGGWERYRVVSVVNCFKSFQVLDLELFWWIEFHCFGLLCFLGCLKLMMDIFCLCADSFVHSDVSSFLFTINCKLPNVCVIVI